MSTQQFPRILSACHDLLDVGMTPKPTDCIFVFAGRPERKTYALQLFREGYAKRLIISVGRFEWRRFLKLGLADDGGLRQLVEKTLPRQRHFFICMNESQTEAFLVPRHGFGTLSEAIALSHFVETLELKNLMIVSSAFHLRRAMNAVRNCCKNFNTELMPVAVPEALASEMRTTWWKTSQGISLLASEYCKNVLYSLMLNPLCQFISRLGRRQKLGISVLCAFIVFTRLSILAPFICQSI